MASGCIAGRNTEPSVASQCRSMEAAAGDDDSFVDRETAPGKSAVTANQGEAEAAVTGPDISSVTAKQEAGEAVVTGPDISAVTAKEGEAEAAVTGPDIAAVTANGKEVVTGRELPIFPAKRTGEATGKEMSPFIANGEPIITVPAHLLNHYKTVLVNLTAYGHRKVITAHALIPLSSDLPCEKRKKLYSLLMR
jgi:hypothetical protein